MEGLKLPLEKAAPKQPSTIRQKVKIRLDLKSFSASFNEQITQITRVYFNSGQRNVGAEPVYCEAPLG